jgi:TetR/AcrR family transcriptional repressor of nem operon
VLEIPTVRSIFDIKSSQIMNKGEKTKQHILETASGLFNTKGIAGTSVDDVVKKAHVARGCLYGHYENKDALALASVDHLLKSANDYRDAVLTEYKSSYDKIFAILKLSLNPFNPFRESGCPVMNLGTEADDTDPRIKQILKKDISENLQLITAILHDGIINKEFSDKLVSAEFAIRMLCSVKGAIVLSKITESDHPLKTVIRALKDELSNFRLNRKS